MCRLFTPAIVSFLPLKPVSHATVWAFMSRLIARNGSGTDISLRAYPLLSASMCYQSPLRVCVRVRDLMYVFWDAVGGYSGCGCMCVSALAVCSHSMAACYQCLFGVKSPLSLRVLAGVI